MDYSRSAAVFVCLSHLHTGGKKAIIWSVTTLVSPTFTFKKAHLVQKRAMRAKVFYPDFGSKMQTRSKAEFQLELQLESFLATLVQIRVATGKSWQMYQNINIFYAQKQSRDL